MTDVERRRGSAEAEHAQTRREKESRKRALYPRGQHKMVQDTLQQALPPLVTRTSKKSTTHTLDPSIQRGGGAISSNPKSGPSIAPVQILESRFRTPSRIVSSGHAMTLKEQCNVNSEGVSRAPSGPGPHHQPDLASSTATSNHTPASTTMDERTNLVRPENHWLR